MADPSSTAKCPILDEPQERPPFDRPRRALGRVVPLHPRRRRGIRRRAADGAARRHRRAVPRRADAHALRAARADRAAAPARVAALRRRPAQFRRAVLPVRVRRAHAVGGRHVGHQCDNAALGRARRLPVAEGFAVAAARARPRDRLRRRAHARLGSGVLAARGESGITRDGRARRRRGARRDAAVRHRRELHETQAHGRRSARQRDGQHGRRDDPAAAVRARHVARRARLRARMGLGARARYRLHGRRLFHFLPPDRAYRAGARDHRHVRDPGVRHPVGRALSRRARVVRDARGLRDRAARHRARHRRDQAHSRRSAPAQRGGLTSGGRRRATPAAGSARRPRRGDGATEARRRIARCGAVRRIGEWSGAGRTATASGRRHRQMPFVREPLRTCERHFVRHRFNAWHAGVRRIRGRRRSSANRCELANGIRPPALQRLSHRRSPHTRAVARPAT
ncbi:putative membrane domain protein [Burkholderia pseudomallei]|nr:putative membrane domain protein [Burkholderia pseudomallei]